MNLGFAPGTLAVWASLFFGVAAMGAYLRALRFAPAAAANGGATFEPGRDRPFDRAVGLARRLYGGYVFAVVLTAGLLLRLLLTHDFRVSYIASYSGRDLPLHYLFSSFWAGQEGSFLLWIFWGALIGLVVARSAREQEPAVMTVYLLTFVGLVAILAKQSPFRFLAQLPADGQGLNPLLQDPWMVIHPPVMFAGFASLSVPFAFAIGALWTRRWDGWVVRAMPWALFTFVCLGTAILMGGYWAYKTLGWGGYWAWDPVENTSLVPWLATVALVHGMFLQRTREKHRKINLVLAILAFCCILYGTFLTRSGVLADFSVHSFVDLGITGWLVALIGVFLFGGAALLGSRWREIPRDPDADRPDADEPFLSRSVLFILSVTLLGASALVILLGTSAPILTRLTGKASQVATSFYNVTHAPVAFLIASLLILVPVLSWKGESAASALKKAAAAIAVGVASLGGFALAGIRAPRDLAILGVAVAGAWANATTVALFVRRKAVTSSGGYLAHVGVAVMLVGILVSGVYERKATVTLERGKPLGVGRHDLTFTRSVFVTEDGRVVPDPATLDMRRLEDARAKQAMEVRVLSPNGKTWLAYPKMWMNPRSQQLMANPDIDNRPLLDLYLSPQSYDPGSPARTEGTLLSLRRGEPKTKFGWSFELVTFLPDRSQLEGERPRVVVTTLVRVAGPDGSGEVRPTTTMEASEPPRSSAAFAELPGGKARLRVRQMNGNEGTAEVEVLGLDPKGDMKPATFESLTVDVTTKPFIALVWGGFYVMMAGGLLSLLRRGRDARRAALA